MAEEVEAGKEGEGAQAVPETASQSAPEASVAPVPAPSRPVWGSGLLLLALFAVLLSVAGVFGLAHAQPSSLKLGLGLLLWGALDLAAQARGLVSWKGPKAAVGNVVNLLRGLGLLALGAWLLLSGAGVLKALNPAVILWTLVCLVFLYLAAVLVLEMMVEGLRVGGQAFLLAALVLMFFSYFYFSIPFTYSWAALLAALAFLFAALAVHRGALAQGRSLTVAVLLVVLGLGAPLLTFTYQQAYVLEEQPLFTPTLLVPRMTQILHGLGPHAGQLRWAPVDTQPGQPGDVLFSDKVALVDEDRGRTVVKLFQQHPNGLREVLRVPVSADVSLTAFSEDGRRVSLTEAAPAPKGSAAAKASKAAAELEVVLEPFHGTPPSETVTAALVLPALPPFSFRRLGPWLAALWSRWTARFGAGRSDALDNMLAHGKLSRSDLLDNLLGLAYQARVVARGVAPGPSHGQVWRAPLGRQLYYAAPDGGPRNLGSAVWRYDFNTDRAERLLKGRAYPAVSPDGKSLLSVGFTPRVRYFEIADVATGEFGDLVPAHERRFDAAKEAAYFPAWDSTETEVLYRDAAGSGLMIMDANGHDRRPFDPKDLDSEHWRTSDRTPFLLRWVTIGDTYSVWRSKPDGSGQRLVYATQSRDISPPQWSADGKRVAFIVLGNDGLSRIFTVGSDGSWPRFFFATKDALDELKWSPDSLRLAWICRRSGGPEEIWTAGYEGLDPKRVHVDDAHIRGLTWSPLGKQLAVQQTRSWTFLGLRVVKPDLRTVLMVDLIDDHARVMTRYGLMSWDPDFSPHGEAIAYFTDEHPWSWRALRPRDSALVVSQLY